MQVVKKEPGKAKRNVRQQVRNFMAECQMGMRYTVMLESKNHLSQIRTNLNQLSQDEAFKFQTKVTGDGMLEITKVERD